MKLTNLIEHFKYTVIKGDTAIDVDKVIFDSRKAEPGALFVCISGAVTDGHRYIQDVVSKGARAVIVEGTDHDISAVPDDVTVIAADDTRYALACVSAA